MTTTELAHHLLDRAVAEEQVAYRVQTDDDIPSVRRIIRDLARSRSIRIRTSVIDGGVLVVVLADAAVWDDTTAVMKHKLTPQPD